MSTVYSHKAVTYRQLRLFLLDELKRARTLNNPTRSDLIRNTFKGYMHSDPDSDNVVIDSDDGHEEMPTYTVLEFLHMFSGWDAPAVAAIKPVWEASYNMYLAHIEYGKAVATLRGDSWESNSSDGNGNGSDNDDENENMWADREKREAKRDLYMRVYSCQLFIDEVYTALAYKVAQWMESQSK